MNAQSSDTGADTAIAIHWFRQDLRLGDNPALARAVKAGALLPIYILDDEAAGAFAMGGGKPLVAASGA